MPDSTDLAFAIFVSVVVGAVLLAAYIVVVAQILRDQSMGDWARWAWIVLVLVAPLVGVLIWLAVGHRTAAVERELGGIKRRIF